MKVRNHLKTSQNHILKETCLTYLLQVEVIENTEGQVDQVFCANCALVWGGTALISNMYNPPRRAETEPTIEWFKKRDFKVCQHCELCDL